MRIWRSVVTPHPYMTEIDVAHLAQGREAPSLWKSIVDTFPYILVPNLLGLEKFPTFVEILDSASGLWGQKKIGELYEKYFETGKSQGTEWKIPQIIEKSGNRAKNTSGQGKVDELSETISKVRENLLNWVKNTSNNGIVGWGEGGNSSQRTQARWA